MAIIIQGKELTKMRYKNPLFITNKDVLWGLFYYIIQIVLQFLFWSWSLNQFGTGVQTTGIKKKIIGVQLIYKVLV